MAPDGSLLDRPGDILEPWLGRLSPAVRGWLRGAPPGVLRWARDAAMVARGLRAEPWPASRRYAVPSGRAASPRPGALPGERWLRVVARRRETPDAVSVMFERPADVSFEAGQFLTLLVPTGAVAVPRSYSLSSTPAPGEPLAIAVKRVPGGVGSAYVHERLRPGQVARARGPSGDFTSRPGGGPERLLLVAGGSGSAPLMGIARTALGAGARVELFVLACVARPLTEVALEPLAPDPARRAPCAHATYFDWAYAADRPQMSELYRRATRNQWDGDADLDWSIDVDPMNPEVPLLPYEYFASERIGRRFGARRDSAADLKLRYELACWMLSQFLHGEQGALHAAAQVTESVRWMDGKFYVATQVMDEARHVEVFRRYLETKLGKLYAVNDNLFVIIDALTHDGRWDMKFLGMQLMIEGLALGAFGTLYKSTAEPLLKALLRNVIRDEARHVHFGVIALREHYRTALSPAELRERQDWAFEVALLMRKRPARTRPSSTATRCSPNSTAAAPPGRSASPPRDPSRRAAPSPRGG
jgi:hypothetical protein